MTTCCELKMISHEETVEENENIIEVEELIVDLVEFKNKFKGVVASLRNELHNENIYGI